MPAGERALGPQLFEQEAGRFWSLVEARPYMRARLGLAQVLEALGAVEGVSNPEIAETLGVSLPAVKSRAHHGVGHDHLQAYLDEFAFRFNRRRTPMAAFQTLLGLAAGVHGPTTYDMLYRSESTR